MATGDISRDFEPSLALRLQQADDTPIPLPFAIGGDRDKLMVGYTPQYVNYECGISRAFEIPTARGGSAVSRPLMNAIGYAASLGGYLWQMGYFPTFSQAVCDKIGGYPKGVVLKDFSKAYDQTDGNYALVREVVSLQDNNTKNFVYSEDNPDPYIIGSEDSNGVVWWQYVEEIGDTSIYAPDYSNWRMLRELQCYGDAKCSWTSTENGWILLSINKINGDGEWLEAKSPTFPIGTLYQVKRVNNRRSPIHMYWDMDKRVPLRSSDETPPVPSKVYYFGYSSDDSIWNGRTSVSDENFMIYSSEDGDSIQLVFPSNVGTIHKIYAYANSDVPLTVTIYSLNTFSSPSAT